MAPNGTELMCRSKTDSNAPNNTEKLQGHFSVTQLAVEAVQKGQVSFGVKASVVEATKKFGVWLGNLDLHPTRKVFFTWEGLDQNKKMCKHIWEPLVALRNDLLLLQHDDDEQTSLDSKCLLLRVEQALKALCNTINKVPGEFEVCVCAQHTEEERRRLKGLEGFMAKKG